MRILRLLHALTLCAGFASSVWLLGLLIFVAKVNTYVESPIDDRLTQTDAIVVLTGGSERITTGLDLLAAGRARKLFISGVHPGLTIDRVVGEHPISPALRSCCIILGYEADNTVGNANETVAWLRAEHFHSIRLVTSHYHMLRSILLFRQALPTDRIIPHAVVPETVKLQDWWERPGTASLLVMEYNKYLLAFAKANFI